MQAAGSFVADFGYEVVFSLSVVPAGRAFLCANAGSAVRETLSAGIEPIQGRLEGILHTCLAIAAGRRLRALADACFASAFG